jgi:hypothetical protein
MAEGITEVTGGDFHGREIDRIGKSLDGFADGANSIQIVLAASTACQHGDHAQTEFLTTNHHRDLKAATAASATRAST